MKSFTAIALEGFPLVEPDDDLAEMIVRTATRNRLELEDEDVIVVAQKVFSKAENRVVNLRDILPSEEAKKLAKITGKLSKFVELVLRETRKVLKASHGILLVEDKRGLICINAGIDKSNVAGNGIFALLPENPDRSAEKCRAGITALTGKKVAVIICDTFSRPFRRGQVNFAIGVAGIKLFKDYRGKKDIFGQVLKVKNVAIVDEIAAAAELLMGQAEEARPVVILKGLSDFAGLLGKSRIEDMEISRDEDLFRGVL